jgi:hypothetical protein
LGLLQGFTVAIHHCCCIKKALHAPRRPPDVMATSTSCAGLIQM